MTRKSKTQEMSDAIFPIHEQPVPAPREPVNMEAALDAMVGPAGEGPAKEPKAKRTPAMSVIAAIAEVGARRAKKQKALDDALVSVAGEEGLKVARKALKTNTSLASPGLTIGAVRDAFIGNMRASGNSESTGSSYNQDLGIAVATLGDVLLADLTPVQIRAYSTSAPVMAKGNGKPKAEPTFKKTRRVLRLALGYAHKALGFEGPHAEQLLAAAEEAL